VQDDTVSRTIREVTGEVDGKPVRVSWSSIRPSVGDTLNVKHGENQLNYIVTPEDVNTDGTVNIPVAVNKIAEALRVFFLPIPEILSGINQLIRMRLDERTQEMSIPPVTGNPKEYAKRLRTEARAPFPQMPIPKDTPQVPEYMREFSGLRTTFKNQFNDVIKSDAPDDVKKAQVEYLVSKLLNMYEDAASTTASFSWKDSINPEAPKRISWFRGAERTNDLQTPETFRTLLLESGVKEIGSLVDDAPASFKRVVRQTTNELLKNRGYNITVS